MRDVVVRCGGGQVRQPPGVDVLDLDVDAPKDSPAKVRLSLNHITARMVQDVPDVLADLLEIACYVYCADQLTRRDTPTMHRLGESWRRRFRFVIPVRDQKLWQRPDVLSALTNTLGFLSEDAHEFTFIPRSISTGLQPYLDLASDGPPGGFTPDQVFLFSGGLDSLTGAAQALFADGRRVALVSHQSSPMVRSKQLDLVDALRERAPGSSLFHVSVHITKGQQEAVEFTQRSRSFLFAALGFVVAYLFRQTELTFFENGVVSMNLPVARHVLGSRATRTTHPRVLSGFSTLFSLLAGHAFRVVNPYFWLTKTEVVSRLGALGCADLIPRSFSCARVRHATQTKAQCGLCSQCVDRRFAVLAAGLGGHEPPEGYEVDLLRGERSPGPDVTLAESYVLTATRFSGLSPVAFAARYGEVFRALPYLEGASHEEKLQRLYDLHSRHGAAIASVVQRELASISLPDFLALPSTSLLALVQSNVAEGPIQLDPVESEPSASAQAAEMKASPVERPIRFAVDEHVKRVVIAPDIALVGSSYRLFETLLCAHRQDRAAGRPPEEFRYIATRKIADQLKVEEGSVRRIVERTRKTLVQQFLEHTQALVNDEDVIQTLKWQGYRLNPFLDERSISFILGADRSRRGEVSRKRRRAVTTRSPKP
jgi:7-cyano-7-deazaguanine synthase in queuosine biosynthesis